MYMSYNFLCQEEERKKKEDEEKAKKEQEAKEKEQAASDRIPDEPPLEKHHLDEFVNNMLPGCFKLLDELSDTVYRYVLVLSEFRA